MCLLTLFLLGLSNQFACSRLRPLRVGDVEAGKRVARTHCVQCHAPFSGSIAPSLFDYKMNVQLDFLEENIRMEFNKQVCKKHKEYCPSLSRLEITNLIAYLQSL